MPSVTGPTMEAIKAYRAIREQEKARGRKPVKLRIEHVQLLSPDNLADFKQLGIHASMQPLHATSDMEMADKYWGKRSRLAYAWNSILSNGANLVFGSDAPVESPDPFRGLHAAVTRQRTDGSTRSCWLDTRGTDNIESGSGCLHNGTCSIKPAWNQNRTAGTWMRRRFDPYWTPIHSWRRHRNCIK